MAEDKKQEKISIKDAYKTSVRLFFLVWRHNKVLFTLNILTSILPTLLGIANLYIYKYLIDAVAHTLVVHTINYTQFYWLIGARLTSLGLLTVANNLNGLTEDLVWLKMPNTIQNMYVTHLSSLDQETLEDGSFRTIMEKATNGIAFRPQELIDRLILAMQSAIGVIGYLTVLAHANILLVLIVIITVIPEFIKQTHFAKITFGVWSWQSPLRKRVLYLNNLLTNYTAIQELKLYKLRERFLGDLRVMWQNFFLEQQAITKKSFSIGLGINFSQTIIFGGIEAYFIFQAILQKITFGDIGLYTSSTSNFRGSLSDFFKNIIRVYENSQYIQSIFHVLDTKPLIVNNEHAQKLISMHTPKIEFRNVSFRYPKSKKYVLKDFSLILNPGQKVALVGENGAGKTTIISLLARIYEPTQGAILVDNVPLPDIDIDSWRQTLGILFQGYSKFEYSLKDNIHFGDIEQPLDDTAIISAAKASDADKVANTLENKYDQMLGKTFEKGVELSGGQWQRVSLARAFFKNAPILVLDEPTAAIDAKAEAEIFDKVQKLSTDKTVIIISHRFSTVRHADVIYVLDKGKIIESGNHEQLMKKKGKYAELFTLQAKGYQ